MVATTKGDDHVGWFGASRLLYHPSSRDSRSSWLGWGGVISTDRGTGEIPPVAPIVLSDGYVPLTYLSASHPIVGYL